MFDYRWVDWCCIIYIWVDWCLIIGGVDWCSNLDGRIIVQLYVGGLVFDYG